MNIPLLFSHGRSGSGTFGRILETISGLECLWEPFFFNDKFVNQIESVSDIAELVLDDKLIKHCYENFGRYENLDFYDLNKRLVDQYDSVIFLYRKNSLKYTLSHMIAHETGTWHVSGTKQQKQYRGEVLEGGLESFEISKLQHHIDNHEKNTSIFRDYISENTENAFLVEHESFYNSSFSIQLHLLKKISGFFGWDFPKDDTKIKRLLNPNNQKVNSLNVYKSIANFDEINEEFGPRWGYLK